MNQRMGGPRRGLSVVLGAVGVAVLLVGLGVVIGRSSVPSFPGGQGTPPRSCAPSASAPTTPAGAGPSRTVNGVPVGYAHSQAGAVAAATTFERVLGPLVIKPEALRTAVATMATPDARDALIRQYEEISDTLNTRLHLVTDAARGVPTASVDFPLVSRVVHYDGATAQIDIWGVAVLADQGTLAPSSTWGTEGYSLRWVDDDWRLVADALDHSVPPLAPALLGQSTTDTAIPPQLTDFQGYHYAFDR